MALLGGNTGYTREDRSGIVEDGVPTQEPKSIALEEDNAEREKEDREEFLARKREASKRFQERKAKKAKEQYENGLALRDELVNEGIFESLSKESRDFVLELCQDPATKAESPRGIAGPSVFTTLFGDNPKVGDTLTLEQVFNKTYKGKATMDTWLKRWSEKGISVSFTPNKEKFLESIYRIDAL
jgi:hypothetical protein